MEGTVCRVPRTVDEVFIDFRGRRAGLIKAFTTDFRKFHHQCDPEMGSLCLYGFPNETWKVDLPVEEVPPALPEPAVGINLTRDDLQANDWLSYVSIHSDTWLISVAFYFAVLLRFSKSERRRLFQMINEQPTIFEAVAGAVKPATNEASAQNNGSKNNSSGRMPSRQPEPQSKYEDKSAGDEEEEEDEQGSTCGDNYANDESGLAISVKNGSMGNA